MKSLYTALLLLLISGSTLIFAQTYSPANTDAPLSFRNRALAGTIPDNLDLVFDPIELRFVEGTHIFTNLSNLTSGDEQVLQNQSDNEYLIGVASQSRLFPNLWGSLLVRFRNNRASAPIAIDSDLDGFDDIFEEGSVQNNHTELLDVDSDGLFDIRQTIFQERRNFPSTRMFMLVNNYSYLSGRWTLGLRLAYGRDGDKSTTADGIYGSGTGPLLGVEKGAASSGFDFRVVNLPTNLPNFLQSEFGNFLTENKGRFTLISGSAMSRLRIGNLRNVEFRLDAGYRQEKQTRSIFDTYDGSFANFNSEINGFQDNFQETQTDISSITNLADGFHSGFSLKQVFNAGDERRYDGFWKFGVDYTRMWLDYDFDNAGSVIRNQSVFDGSDTLRTDINSAINASQSTVAANSGTFDRIAFSAQVNAPLDERLTFGIGATYRYSKVDRDGDQEFLVAQNNSFEVIDATRGNDFDQVVNETASGALTFSSEEHRIILPVGIEYSLTKSQKWRLRFGALFDFVKRVENDRFEVTDAQPRVVTTQFSDNTTDVRLIDNTTVSTSRQDKTNASSTDFLYGLGYSPLTNLQIDILGFLGTDENTEILSTEFLRQLRLSFTLRI